MKHIKSTTALVFFLILTLVVGGPIYASDSGSAYVGADVDKQTADLDAKTLGVLDYKIYTANQADTTLVDTSLPITDAVTLKNASGTGIALVQNTDSGVDTLGYLDFAIALGIDNSSARIINHHTKTSLAMLISAYRANGGTVDTDRIALVAQEIDLYTALVTETKSVNKASEFFFNVEKEIMADPDLNIYTNGITIISLSRENVTISQTLKDKINTWVHDYITKGNNWTGFFREVNVPEQSGSTISVSYSSLSSAPAQDTGVSTEKKFGALVVFILFLAILVYFIYKGRQGSLIK